MPITSINPSVSWHWCSPCHRRRSWKGTEISDTKAGILTTRIEILGGKWCHTKQSLNVPCAIWAVFETLVTFHYTSCLIGILIKFIIIPIYLGSIPYITLHNQGPFFFTARDLILDSFHPKKKNGSSSPASSSRRSFRKVSCCWISFWW